MSWIWWLVLPSLMLTLEGLWQAWTRRPRQVESREGDPRGRYLIIFPAYKDKVDIQSWRAALTGVDVDIVVVEDDGLVNDGAPDIYITRDSRNGFKGGALNHAFEILLSQEKDYDWVLIFDADHIPKPSDLLAYLAFLDDTRANVVQAFWADGLPLSKWYHWLLWVGRRNSNWNLLNRRFRNLTGNGVALRWSLVKEGVRFPHSITEDYALSLELISAGERIEVFPHIVSVGRAPTSFKAFVKQQLRWAEGTLRDSLQRFTMVWGALGTRERLEFLLHVNLYLQGLWLLMALVVTGIVGQWSVLFALGIVQALCYVSLVKDGRLRYLPLYFGVIYVMMFVQIWALVRALTLDGMFEVTVKEVEKSSQGEVS